MTCFRFDVGARRRKAGRLIGRVRSELLEALWEELLASNMTIDDLARKLNVPRSTINKQLEGGAKLTLRALADLAWALDRDVTFELTRRVEISGQNSGRDTSTVHTTQMKVVGEQKATSSTLPYPANSRITVRSR